MPSVVMDISPEFPVAFDTYVYPSKLTPTTFYDTRAGLGMLVVVRCLPKDVRTEVFETLLYEEVELPEDSDYVEAACEPYIKSAYKKVIVEHDEAYISRFENLDDADYGKIVRHIMTMVPN